MSVKPESLKHQPGSLEAILKGCICPPVANRFGEGYIKSQDGKGACFVLAGGCPVHIVPPFPTGDDEETL